MNFNNLLKIADKYDTILDTVRTPNIPYGSKRKEPQVQVVDADGLTDNDYQQSDPAREQTLTQLKELQKLTTKAMQQVACGQVADMILPYILYMKNMCCMLSITAK